MDGELDQLRQRIDDLVLRTDRQPTVLDLEPARFRKLKQELRRHPSYVCDRPVPLREDVLEVLGVLVVERVAYSP